MSKDLFSSRTPFEKCYLVENVKHLSFIPGNRTLRTAHVNRIFKAFLDGEWMPPIYVSADGEVLDGQNRLAAFRMLKAYLEKGLHGYQQLQDFTKAFPEFEFKAAIQLIKGSHSSRKFNNGLLEISNEEYMEACKKAAALIQIAEKLNNKIVLRRDIVLAFYHVWNKIPNIQTYLKRIGNLQVPSVENRKEWELAYSALLR